MECRRQTDATPACLVIPARRFTPVPARAQGSANCPFCSAYVYYLGARRFKGGSRRAFETRSLSGALFQAWLEGSCSPHTF